MQCMLDLMLLFLMCLHYRCSYYFLYEFLCCHYSRRPTFSQQYGNCNLHSWYNPLLWTIHCSSHVLCDTVHYACHPVLLLQNDFPVFPRHHTKDSTSTYLLYHNMLNSMLMLIPLHRSADHPIPRLL